MVAGIANRVSLVQTTGTPSAPLREMVTDLVHPIRGHQRPSMPRMPRLTPGPATTLEASASHALTTGESIRGRRLRGDRRILLSEGELPFEIGDALRVFGELFAQPFVLLSQPFVLLRKAIVDAASLPLASRSFLVPRLHQPKRSESM